MRALQGCVPVVAMSFADVKGSMLAETLAALRCVIAGAVEDHAYLRDSDALTDKDRSFLARVSDGMPKDMAVSAIKRLCTMLCRHWGVAPVVLLDECASPMVSAWTAGFWEGASDFLRQLMDATFGANRDLGRALITGVAYLGSGSSVYDLDNLKVVTVTSRTYRTAFGFTDEEVRSALAENGLADRFDTVRDWYDGFTFGGVSGVYNPWTITNYLESGGIVDTYWANTSGNALVSNIVRRGGSSLKADFETLMGGGEIEKVIDERVVFQELGSRADAVWALLLAAGYLTSPGPVSGLVALEPRRLRIANREVRLTFDRMVEGWFVDAGDDWDDFARALLAGDARRATRTLATVTCCCMSSFDGTQKPAEREPERFYHGLVLGLLARLRNRWSV